MAEPCEHAPPPAAWSDAELVAAMRAGDETAVAELYLRFRPFLLRLAGRHGLQRGERAELVGEVLADVALALLDPAAPAPRALAAYLAAALRNAVTMRRRSGARRAHWLIAASADDAGDAAVRPRRVAEGGAVRALQSEHSLRASAGPDDDALALDPALAALVLRLERELTDGDRQLLVWLSHHVPLRTAAEWLGVKYDTAAKRASRLKARLRAVAVRHAGELPARERRRLHHFFARAGIALPAAGEAPTASGTPPRDPDEETTS